MEVRTAASPKDVKHYTTDRLREEFLIQDLFQADKINLVYSHIDRIITGAAVPVNEKLVLTAGDELRAEYFLQRRELGIINIGGDGIITIQSGRHRQYHDQRKTDFTLRCPDPGKRHDHPRRKSRKIQIFQKHDQKDEKCSIFKKIICQCLDTHRKRPPLLLYLS